MSGVEPRRVVGLLIAIASALGVSLVAFAAEYPSRPITIIVPFPAGGGGDVQARLIAKTLAWAVFLARPRKRTFISPNWRLITRKGCSPARSYGSCALSRWD
jgi:hypothetical protein